MRIPPGGPKIYKTDKKGTKMYKDTKEARMYITRKKNIDKYYDQFGSDDTYNKIEEELALWAANNENKIFAPSVHDGLTIEELINIKRTI